MRTVVDTVSFSLLYQLPQITSIWPVEAAKKHLSKLRLLQGHPNLPLEAFGCILDACWEVGGMGGSPLKTWVTGVRKFTVGLMQCALFLGFAQPSFALERRC